AGIVTRSIESAQRKVEARNFDMRKQLLEYDDVANDQRKVIYQQRNDILDSTDLEGMLAAMREDVITDVVRQFVPAESMEEQWDIPGLEKALAGEWQLSLDLQNDVAASDSITDEEILEKVVKAAHEMYESKLALIGKENFTQFQRAVLLQSFDSNWRDHLAALDYLRQGIHLRGYAQKQPKQEYKREAFELFRQLIDQVKTEVTRVLMTVQVRSREEMDEAAVAMNERGAQSLEHMSYAGPSDTEGDAEDGDVVLAETLAMPDGVHVGRNDPCPCGSGKKFKQCHGKLS
ncbi:MAG: SEC-C metal-binding domain-containing protein, partial [Comamonas sp.]